MDSTTGELSVQAIPCSTPVKSSLPSLHMRQWHKLANVVGVAIGLGAISSKKKSSSDPEITTMTSPELDRGSQSQSLMSEEDGMTTSSSFSGLYGLTDDLDFDLASTLSFDSRMASIPSRRRVRKNSETQSEYILEASAKLRQQRFLREDCDCDNTTPVVPAIDIIVPSSPSLTSSHSSSSDKVLEV